MEVSQSVIHDLYAGKSYPEITRPESAAEPVQVIYQPRAGARTPTATVRKGNPGSTTATVLKRLIEGGGTIGELFAGLFSNNPRAIIKDLRQRGHSIVREGDRYVLRSAA